MTRSGVRAAWAVVVLAGPAWGVKTQTWTHDQPKAFTSATLENVVVTSLGEVMLGREVKTLGEVGDKADIVNALARAGDGKVYAATGPEGIIYQIDGDEVKPFATLPEGGTVLSLVFDAKGMLLAGTGGGEQAKIYRIDGTGKATVFHEPADATYVWALARGPAGEIYAATGTEGKLFSIAADGTTAKVLADVKPKNVLCLAVGADGMLFAGTDEDGLVYRFDPSDGKTFVLYDAKEPEVSAIVLDGEGNVYASTADADGARPGRQIADKPGGRPEGDEDGGAAASQPRGTAPASNGGSATTQPASTPSARPRANAGRPVSGAKPAEGGNAIYRINTDGFVSEVFREPVMILSMVEAGGTIYAATGNEGRLYAVTPGNDRTTMLAKLDATQATCLLRLPEGTLIVGTANEPAVVRVADQRASKGTLVSEPLDAEQVVKWGRLSWEATVPAGTKLTVATRSSNVADKESDAWDAWSAEMDAASPQQVSSVSARFLQYRLTFESTLADATPVLREIELARIEENRPPLIKSVEVVSVQEEVKNPASPPKVKAMVRFQGMGEESEAPEPQTHWVIKWQAEDPNKDPLIYNVYFRELGRDRWIRMAKEQKEPFAIWDTTTVADGKYEVRVEAKDTKGNPAGTELSNARISDPVTVDNTPPDVEVTRAEAVGKSGAAVEATLTDAASPIAEASYTVDSDDEWIPLAADDDIFDTSRETVTVNVSDLEPGEHRIALRVLDGQGNARPVSVAVTVGN